MCDACEVVNINGCNCHETGCPDAWKDAERECAWCGETFKPEHSYETHCSWECVSKDNGTYLERE